ncbi:MAG: PQQ-like beta-propeller repeat protein [Planctomycetes bacterium]|nr:PQQ-like beta-propeller repeat protein [Planctomycetota bacterium]
MFGRRTVLVLWVVALSSQGYCAQSDPAQGSDWPQFLGPNRNGASPEKGLLREWPKEGPPVAWRVPISQGWSCPSISGSDVFVHGTEPGNAKETVVCLDAATGKERWKTTYPCEVYWKGNIGWPHGGVRATPCVTAKEVFTLGAQGDLYCLDRNTGQAVWNTDLRKAYVPEEERKDWKGFCMSPLLVDGRLIFYTNFSGNLKKDKEAGLCEIVALDPATGKEAWKYSRTCRPQTRGIGGQTPAVVTVNGSQHVLFTANFALHAIRANDGEELKFGTYDYYHEGWTGATIATPLVVGDYVVENPTWYAPYIAKINFADPNGKPQIVWQEKYIGGTCPIGNFVPSNGYLFGFMTEKDNGAIMAGGPGFDKQDIDLHCIELATGKRMWVNKGIKFGYSMITADGLLFIRSYKSLILAEASPKEYVEKGRIDNLFQGPTTMGSEGGWVMPVLAHGRLYVRLPKELICYNITNESAKPRAPTP